MTNGRVKGASFEREICKMLVNELAEDAAELGVLFDPKRNLEQTRAASQGDITDVEGWEIECKRYKSSGAGRPDGFKSQWWKQCTTAANARGTEPALIFKYDRQPIQCVVRLSSINADYLGKDNVAQISFPTLCMLIRESWIND